MIYEVSFECGNKVGGIHTVISTKAPFVKKYFPYTAIGFYNEKQAKKEFVEKTPPAHLKNVFLELEKEDIICKYGKWVDPDVDIILIDSNNWKAKNINNLKKMHWEKYSIDSLGAGDDYDTPVAWAHCAGKLLEKIIVSTDIVHAHEWLSGAAVLYLKGKVPTVFTTHATVVGRAASSSIDIANAVKSRSLDADKMAKDYGVNAKHNMEKAIAKTADVFTTVSQITADEAEVILGRRPDVVTPNALNFENVPDLPSIRVEYEKYREELNEFIRAYFTPYYPLNPSLAPIIFTAGRHEFKNKGYDIFIDSLAELNKRLKNNTVVAFLFIPSKHNGPNAEVLDNIVTYQRVKEMMDTSWEKVKEKIISELSLSDAIDNEIVPDKVIAELRAAADQLHSKRGKNPPISAYNINNEITSMLEQKGLLNRPTDHVKVVYYPVYLGEADKMLGMTYKQVITAGDIGVFMSRYEPWGYTPLEAVSYASCSILSDSSGFGSFLKQHKLIDGLYVVNTVGVDYHTVVKNVTDYLEKLVNMPDEERFKIELNVREYVEELCSWDVQIKEYLKAYELAKSRFGK